jgi:mercuric ion transport protein
VPFDSFERSSARADGEERDGQAARLAGIGSVVGALASSSCCLIPLLLFSLGLSGVWLGALTSLAPYQPWMLAATAACIGVGFYFAYRRPRGACAAAGACARPGRRRLVLAALWSAALLALVAAAFPYLAPVLLDV